MTGSRSVAYRILRDVERGGYAADLLYAALRELDSHDAGLAEEIVFSLFVLTMLGGLKVVVPALGTGMNVLNRFTAMGENAFDGITPFGNTHCDVDTHFDEL